MSPPAHCPRKMGFPDGHPFSAFFTQTPALIIWLEYFYSLVLSQTRNNPFEINYSQEATSCRILEWSKNGKAHQKDGSDTESGSLSKKLCQSCHLRSSTNHWTSADFSFLTSKTRYPPLCPPPTQVTWSSGSLFWLHSGVIWGAFKTPMPWSHLPKILVQLFWGAAWA